MAGGTAHHGININYSARSHTHEDVVMLPPYHVFIEGSCQLLLTRHGKRVNENYYKNSHTEIDIMVGGTV